MRIAFAFSILPDFVQIQHFFREGLTLPYTVTKLSYKNKLNVLTQSHLGWVLMFYHVNNRLEG